MLGKEIYVMPNEDMLIWLLVEAWTFCLSNFVFDREGTARIGDSTLNGTFIFVTFYAEFVVGN